MKKTLLAALSASTLGLGACSLEVPDLNNPSLESLRDSPTPSGVYAASTGLLLGSRSGKSSQNGYVAHLGLLGRESYTFDAGDPRFVTEMLAGASLDPGSPAFGGSQWSLPYANIRNANTVLGALEKVSGIIDADKEAIRGFAKTMQALDFLVIVTTRDTNGGPIDVGGDYSQLAPIVSKEQLLAHISTLLDESKTHLAAAGEEFPFPLSSGYEGFDTPATFVKFNRAVKARVAVYQEDWQGALQALSESFVDKTKPMSLGVYHSFGTGSGDTTNGLTSPNIFAHPSIVTDIQPTGPYADYRKVDCTDDAAQPFKCLDNRVGSKLEVAESRTYQGLTSNYVFTLYSSNSSPLPIIRNEELLLLRAEANIQLTHYTEAADDINHVRAVSGGLPPVELVGENAVDVLLKERRFSLLFEGGHRWIDMRRYQQLDALPKDKPDHAVHPRFPIPVAETDARQ